MGKLEKIEDEVGVLLFVPDHVHPPSRLVPPNRANSVIISSSHSHPLSFAKRTVFAEIPASLINAHSLLFPDAHSLLEAHSLTEALLKG